MYNLYENIYALCKEHGITPGGLCGELGFRRSVLSDLKNGRKKSLDTTTLMKIAEYFNISVDYLLTGEEKETAYTNTGADGETPIAAFFGGIKEDLTEEERQAYWDDAREYIAFKIAQKKGKKE